jgi:cysteinyl-tRNA synthetase
MIQLAEEKMAKSVGNIAPLHDVLDRHDRDAVVMYFLGGHYRQPLAYSDELLDEAAASVQRVREAARRLVPGDSPEDLAPLRDRFSNALADDFGTPAALAAMFEWIREANKRERVGDAHLREMLGVLGLENLLETSQPEVDAEARELLERRERARAERDFAEADRLRDELGARGWEVRDGPGGPELVRRDP